MDTRRAREELGWQPTRSSMDAILDLLAGLHAESGIDTPPLEPGRRRPTGSRVRNRTPVVPEQHTARGGS